MQAVAYSSYVDSHCRQQSPAWQMAEAALNVLRHQPHTLAADLAALLSDAQTQQSCMCRLRQWRHAQTLRIATLDSNPLSKATLYYTDVAAELSDVATTIIRATYDWAYEKCCARYGTPIGAKSNTPQHLVILAMGKLGGGELNFSSDIDVMFAYPEDGVTVGKSDAVDNGEFFTQTARLWIALLTQRTEDGFVYRVDTRLRPFGDSGPLVFSFAALEQYYQTHGRNWERYALIKARAVAGDIAAGEQLLLTLEPFVYRRYVDYSLLEGMREMKAAITRELRARGGEDNIKLGDGGIRMAEFIVQLFQLMRGGKQNGLRTNVFVHGLHAIETLALLPSATCHQLLQAYTVLRIVENRLQQQHDRQVHVLPSDAITQGLLAQSLGFASWHMFVGELREHRQLVHELFVAMLDNGSAVRGDHYAVWRDIWDALSIIEEQEIPALCSSAGKQGCEAWVLRLYRQKHSSHYARLTAEAEKRCEALMPRIMALIAQQEDPDVVLSRVINAIEAVYRRSIYLVHLIEHSAARQQFVALCAASPVVAKMLADQPTLFDELVDENSLYRLHERQSLDETIQLVAYSGELEREMERLRLFRSAHVLRIAALDVLRNLPLMEVSNQLTAVAESVLDRVIACAAYDIARRVRPPNGVFDVDGFAAIAYGKFGGLELSYASDLDLVFIVDDALTGSDQSMTYFMRLAQRVVHMLETMTISGRLYQLDLRLRPNGEAGMLVTTMSAWRDYQQNNAWTWEHQALCRARVVAGDKTLRQSFARERIEILSAPRDLAKLAEDIRSMRRKMRAESMHSSNAAFDLKQGDGGIIDIEFFVQYMVLAYSHAYPTLTHYPDNMRQLEAIKQAELIDADVVTALQNGYLAMRELAHRLALAARPAITDADAFMPVREQVRNVWEHHIDRTAGAVQ